MDDNEKIEYSYTGDVSSLREATETAIGLLGKYESALKNLATSSQFNVTQTALTGFQRSVRALVRQTTNLSKSFEIPDVNIDQALAPNADVVTSAAKDIGDVLDYLESTATATTEDFKLINSVLKDTKDSLSPIVSRASALGTSFKVAGTQTKSSSNEIKSAYESVGNASATAADKIAAADNRIAIANHTAFQNRIFKEYARQFESSMDQTAKSARESAVEINAAFIAAPFEKAISRVRATGSSIQEMLNSTMSRLNNLTRAFDPVVSKMASMKASSVGAMDAIKFKIDSVVTAFRKLAKTESGDASAADESAKSHKSLSSILESVKTSIKKIIKSHKDFKNALKGTTNGLKSMSTELKNTKSKVNGLTNSMGGLRKVFSLLVGVKFGDWLAQSAKESIKYTENLNLFRVAMGDLVDTGQEFVDQMSLIYGMDPSNLMRYAGNFYQLADAIGMPAEAASNMSLGLTKASNDIASLFNVDIETVFNNLSSGMQGMSRAVRRYGMDIRTTTLQQTALSLGIRDSVEEMSEANRQGLRFITMMRQAKNASGDFARTIDQPANQLRIFKEQMSQLGRAIGDLFIAPLTKAIQYLNGFVMALRMVITFIGTILGLVTKVSSNVDTDKLDDVATSVSGIGDAASGAAAELHSLLAPFDELNILQEQNTSGSGGTGSSMGDIGAMDPAIEQSIEDMQWKLENVRMKALEVRDAILSFLGFQFDGNQIISWDSEQFENNLINKFPEWEKTIRAFFDNWSRVIESLKSIFNSLLDVAKDVFSRIHEFISKFINDDSVSAFIEKASDAIEDLASIIEANKDKIADFAMVIVTLGAAFAGLSALGSIVNSIAAFVGALSPITVVAGVVAGAITALYASSESFATSFKNLLKTVAGSVSGIVGAAAEALGSIWQSMQTLWSEHVAPMLQSIGDALAPVLGTLSELWTNATNIIINAIDLIAGIITDTLMPILGAIFDAIGNAADIFKSLWEGVIGPIVEEIGNSIERLWTEVLSPMVGHIASIAGGIADILYGLWNNVLAPIAQWLADIFGPIFGDVFSGIWEIVSEVVLSIGDILNGLFKILDGLINFIAGVFSGNWERAWNGIVSIFGGIWDTLTSVLTVPLNAAIGLINTFLSAIVSGVNAVMRAINRISIHIPEWVPGFGGNVIGFNLPQFEAPQIPYMASGGVVSGPTVAMVGEGRYDEAVIPLGNSPQMNDFADNVASRMNSGEQIALLREQNSLLRQILDKTGVSIDGKSLTKAVSTIQQQQARARGV